MSNKLLITIAIISGVQCNIHGVNIKSQITDSIKQQTPKNLFYLDGVMVTHEIIRETAKKQKDGTLHSNAGALDPREAIRKYGEKFRSGVIFFESTKDENDTSK